MAVFLSRVISRIDGAAPSDEALDGPEFVFEDVPAGVWFHDAVQHVAGAGVTTGCSADPLLFCPGDLVSRAQMAVFLSRVISRIDGAAPSDEALDGPEFVFEDVPAGVWFHDAVQHVAGAGVTTGCSADPLLFCPGDLVSRAQMAVFLSRVISQIDPAEQ